MSWRVSGTWEGIDSWVSWDGKLTYSKIFGEELATMMTQDSRVPMTPTGPIYEITGPLDERGAFLLALWLLEDRTVTGDTPTFEVAPLPEGAVS